jgi:hypothetical protein
MSDDNMHVYPVDDLVLHVMSKECWCIPDIIVSPDGVAIVVHNSADGRELEETVAEDHFGLGSNGVVRYGGQEYSPRSSAQHLNGKNMAFSLYFEPGPPAEVNGEHVPTMRWDSSKIALWGTSAMLATIQNKGWPSQWNPRDQELLVDEAGSRFGLLFWHPKTPASG